jgi:hypothetical protein
VNESPASDLPPLSRESTEALAHCVCDSWKALESAGGDVRPEARATAERLRAGTGWRLERHPATGRWVASRQEGPP